MKLADFNIYPDEDTLVYVVQQGYEVNYAVDIIIDYNDTNLNSAYSLFLKKVSS